MKNIRKSIIKSMMLVIISTLTIQLVNSQQVEVQGELKVTQMTANDTQDNLVIRNTDGTLGTRSAASLPPPPPPIDTTRNLASDFELAKHLCNCPNLPPFMIKKLLESGYTQEELMASGIPIQDVLDAERGGLLLDTRNNQTYKTVTIGTQTWMAENLNYGTLIPENDNQKNNLIIEKYCYGDIVDNCNTYGGLYQWNEMMQYDTIEVTQGICPTGWHLPTDEEWKNLEIEVGMSQTEADLTGFRGIDQGSQLAGNEALWYNGILVQNGSFASSGFAALPGGARYSNGSSGQIITAYFWSSSQSGGNAWERNLFQNNTNIRRFAAVKSIGYSVRCVQN